MLLTRPRVKHLNKAFKKQKKSGMTTKILCHEAPHDVRHDVRHDVTTWWPSWRQTLPHFATKHSISGLYENSYISLFHREPVHGIGRIFRHFRGNRLHPLLAPSTRLHVPGLDLFYSSKYLFLFDIFVNSLSLGACQLVCQPSDRHFSHFMPRHFSDGFSSGFCAKWRKKGGNKLQNINILSFLSPNTL